MNRRILLILSALLIIGFAFCNGGETVRKLGNKITGNEPDPVEKVQNLCPDCKGEGKLPCPRCKGTGKVESYGGVPCGQCNGTGKIHCEKCRGHGKLVQ
jgi:DnaJ-class molecular chaperone